MVCLIRAEGYKLKRSKSFYICIASLAAFILLIYGTLLLVENISNGTMENGTGGVVVSGEIMEEGESLFQSIGVMDILEQVFSGNGFALVLSIFIGIFVVREYNSGTMKNIVGKGYSRNVIFFTRLLMANLAMLLLLAAGLCITLLMGLIFIGTGAFAGAFWQNLAGYMLVQMLLYIAVTTALVFLNEVVRNLGAGIAIGIALTTFFGLLLNGLDLLFAKSGFKISQYWPVTRSIDCPLEGITAGYLGETFLVALFWFLLAAGLGLWHFKKTDI